MMYDRKYNHDGSHECENKECTEVVSFDDEPFCFVHSPDEGSFMIGYSYKANTLNDPK